MTSSSKSGLTVVLIALFVCSLVYANEPNVVDPELKFETGDKVWIFDLESDLKSTVEMLPIKPIYGVKLLLPALPYGYYPQFRKHQSISRPPRSKGKPTPSDRDWNVNKQIIDYSSDEVINALLGTSAAQSFSAGQRQLCKSGYTVTHYGGRRDAYDISLFAVSEEDAKAMTMAFLEFLQKEADKELKFWENEQKRLQQEIPIQEQKLKEAEQKQKALQDEYNELKKQVYYSTTAVARETITEMNKILQTTIIDQASRQAKIMAIREFIAKNQAIRSNNSAKQGSGHNDIDRTAILQKLEQKLVDETIELRSIEAKVSAVSSVLARAKKFVNLDHHITKNVNRSVGSHHARLNDLKDGLKKVESVLADPEPHTKPPKVLENKAVIYPVEIKD